MSKSPIKNTKDKNINEDNMLTCIICNTKIHSSNLKHTCFKIK